MKGFLKGAILAELDNKTSKFKMVLFLQSDLM